MSISDQIRSKKSKGSLIQQTVASVREALLDANISKTFAGNLVSGIATESADYKQFSQTTESISTSLENIISQLKLEVSTEGLIAGQIAAIGSTDVLAYSRASTRTTASSYSKDGSNVTVMSDGVIAGMTGGDASFERSISIEAYDERDNKNAAAYSVAYNMQASRQDEFGETLFPTIVVSPDNVGISVTTRLMLVYDAITRNISGDVTNYNKKNIIRAVADYTILQNDQTKIVPVYKAQSAAHFVDTGVIATKTIITQPGSESVVTSPLKVGSAIDLLGISQTASILAGGVEDMTDSIDPSIQLEAFYVSVTTGSGGSAKTDVLKFNTLNQATATFNNSIQGNYRLMNLAFDSDSILINATTQTNAGGALDALSLIATDNVIVRLRAQLSGSVNIEKGDTTVFGNSFKVVSVTDSTGALLDLTTGTGLTIANLFANVSIVGYDLLAYRTNMNRRSRGQLIDTTFQTQIYNVPLRSPITAIRPVTTDGQNDASDLSALITATHIRTSNSAVTALLAAASTLAQYVDVRDTTGEGPQVLGVGRNLVRAQYAVKNLDMLTAVDSLTSHKRAEDIQAALVNAVRDMAYNLFRDSEYKAAADAMNGGQSPTPTVIIATDPVIARYLLVTGDLRTLGNDFDVKIVSTLDKRMAGKLFVTFGSFNGEQNVGPNPLHFGCMAWKPEMTVVLPISRNNQISKELTVQPSFLHIVNLPILGLINVSNIPSVTGKVSVNTHSV